MDYRKIFFCGASLLLLSCECPYLDEEDRPYHHQAATNGDVFYADELIGTWQCYYPMVIGEMEYKQIKFLSNGKADITMAKQRDTEWFTETYDYAYYGKTIRFSRGRNNISLNIDGYLFPELYLSDSFGYYTIAKRSA